MRKTNVDTVGLNSHQNQIEGFKFTRTIMIKLYVIWLRYALTYKKMQIFENKVF